MEIFKKLFGKKQKAEMSETQKEEEIDPLFQAKKEAMENILGDMFGLVGHAIIPFQIGGAVDMYYFPNAREGMAFATMELIESESKGPIPNRNGMFELLAFTRHKVDKQVGGITGAKGDPFDTIERRICGIFTTIGNYSYTAKLEPGDTCEIPNDKGDNTCLVFDEYKIDGRDFLINGKKYGLLVCIEVFRSEMEYAMKYGSLELFKKLKETGCYPYSDMDRDPVA